ncbi:hypothetical protein [Actinomadura rayongensis]|uniref:hypothetical protein n=1 Tax=Actinomadura rayongensis TaxID=1429076 RepID=UPI001F1EA1AE|nr:hypothetical protein [Actinomadura rayongensis]
MGELEEFLEPDAAVPQDLHGRPLPEGQFLGDGDVEVRAGGQVTDANVGLAAVAVTSFVACCPDALVGASFESEGLTGGPWGCLLQKSAEVVVAIFEVGNESGQKRLAASDAVVDAFLCAPLVGGELSERVVSVDQVLAELGEQDLSGALAGVVAEPEGLPAGQSVGIEQVADSPCEHEPAAGQREHDRGGFPVSGQGDLAGDAGDLLGEGWRGGGLRGGAGGGVRGMVWSEVLLEGGEVGVSGGDGFGVALGLVVFGEGAVDAGQAGVASVAFAGGDDQVFADVFDLLSGG